ncbi:MAG: sigma 54-interacting transcriptional regulator [Bacteriovoracaceae bacterium]|nr:sigma 54-interacting transcriptional regulator [Bacteriovoracaceae bacterium]
MFTSLKEFKFFQAFRIPVESSDDVRFLVECENESGQFAYVKESRLVDISLNGIGFCTKHRFSIGESVRFSISFKKLRFDLNAIVVRAFSANPEDDQIIYGSEIDEEDTGHMKRFIEQYLSSFTPERARDCLVQLALSERYNSATEGFEMFSLLLNLYKDITKFGNQENFVNAMLEEVIRILNAQRASIFLINPESSELEAVAALGIDKKLLKFDYRKGIAGSVFTTGVSLNIDTKADEIRFSQKMDEITGFTTKSIICSPINNREDKTIGVIQVLNKRNEDRFTEEDEKTMKVLSLIFSSVFHNFNPLSENTLIRKFSTPYDREHVIIGRSQSITDLRQSILKLKDIDSPLLITGEVGVGKSLYAKILHIEGKRGLNPWLEVYCDGVDPRVLEQEIFGDGTKMSKLEECKGGTILFHEIGFMPLELQRKLTNTLKNRKIEGSNLTLDIRCIFSSSKDIKKMADETGEFYPELFDLISSSLVTMDPLRRRKLDMEDLVSYFLKKECKKQGLLLKELSPAVIDMFNDYDWPGNVAELERAIHRLVLYNPKAHIISSIETGSMPLFDTKNKQLQLFDDIPFANDFKVALKDRVALIEREMILVEIKRNKGNKSKAAKGMGISREALRKKLLQSQEVFQRLSGIEGPVEEIETLIDEKDQDTDLKEAA